MAGTPHGTQAKSLNLVIRVTPDEKSLLDEYAEVLGTSVADVVRQMGIDEAVRLASRVRERLTAPA